MHEPVHRSAKPRYDLNILNYVINTNVGEGSQVPPTTRVAKGWGSDDPARGGGRRTNGSPPSYKRKGLQSSGSPRLPAAKNPCPKPRRAPQTVPPTLDSRRCSSAGLGASGAAWRSGTC